MNFNFGGAVVLIIAGCSQSPMPHAAPSPTTEPPPVTVAPESANETIARHMRAHGAQFEPSVPTHHWRVVPVTPAMTAYAAAAVEDVVKSGLLAPSTAHVSQPTWIEASEDETGRCHLWASGYADAQNVYGAMLRQDYTAVWEWNDKLDKPIGVGTHIESSSPSLREELLEELVAIMNQRPLP